MTSKTRSPIDSPDALPSALTRLRKAADAFATYSQDRVDAIFRAAALAANRARIPLAQAAVDETGMGVVEDKVIKNHYACEMIYNAYKNVPTCGIIEEDPVFGIRRIAEPIGIIAAVIPTTNPTSTTIFKCLLALKTRNAILISPHPRAKHCTVQTAKLLLEAAVAAGAPAGIIDWIDEPSLDMTGAAMKAADTILATGGPGMVKAAYSSGKPALGVGAGNTPAIIDSSADIRVAVNSVIHSKTFDNGVICASEQSVIVPQDIYTDVRDEFTARGCVVLGPEECDRLRKTLFVNGALNAKIVGQTAFDIAMTAGIAVPSDTKILIGEIDRVDESEVLAREKLSPVLAMVKATDFEDALNKAERMVTDGGYGHTASLYIDPLSQKEKCAAFEARMKTCRVLINTPSSQGGIGDLYNFRLAPSLTLGCGSWGGNSVSDNVGVRHLLNIKTVAERRNNMLWFRTPPKVYMKQGCLPLALDELKQALHKTRVFIVTDAFLFKNGYVDTVIRKLSEQNIAYTVFFDVEPDPTLATAKKGAEAMTAFEPDAVIAVGGGSVMDAAKIMWVLYEHPRADFSDMAMRFMDIRKRIYAFEPMGRKACFIAVPTSSGTGSEVTPFAVITDEQTGTKYPLADYALMPDMAIVDTDLMMKQPPALTAASGIDALTHALEAYASMLATPITDGLALQAIRLIFQYLPRCFDNGSRDPEAREQMAIAATMAGMAFANAFLGICHSMAHKLGAFHHLPHGIANALLIGEVMRFNAAEVPTKMGTFPQYPYPHTRSRYAQIADELDLGGNTEQEKFEMLLRAIEQLKSTVGIQKSIAAYGINAEDFEASLDEMVAQAFDDQCTGANPRYPLMSEMKEMYRRAFNGRRTVGRDDQ